MVAPIIRKFVAIFFPLFHDGGPTMKCNIFTMEWYFPKWWLLFTVSNYSHIRKHYLLPTLQRMQPQCFICDTYPTVTINPIKTRFFGAIYYGHEISFDHLDLGMVRPTIMEWIFLRWKNKRCKKIVYLKIAIDFFSLSCRVLLANRTLL